MKKVTLPVRFGIAISGSLIAYFLILFNDKTVKFQIDGIKSSNKTRGHYIQHNKMITIKSIPQYEKLLRENGVILDQNKRKEKITR